jgi:hypothetical protein
MRVANRHCKDAGLPAGVRQFSRRRGAIRERLATSVRDTQRRPRVARDRQDQHQVVVDGDADDLASWLQQVVAAAVYVDVGDVNLVVGVDQVGRGIVCRRLQVNSKAQREKNQLAFSSGCSMSQTEELAEAEVEHRYRHQR